MFTASGNTLAVNEQQVKAGSQNNEPLKQPANNPKVEVATDVIENRLKCATTNPGTDKYSESNGLEMTSFKRQDSENERSNEEISQKDTSDDGDSDTQNTKVVNSPNLQLTTPDPSQHRDKNVLEISNVNGQAQGE